MMPRIPDLPEDLKLLMPVLLRTARHLTGSADLAQDLSQDVLLKLWARLQRGQEIENLRPYALAALRNQYRQTLRNRWPLTTLEEVTLSTPPAAPSMLALRDLEKAIAHLPADQASLMRLVMAGETSPIELARLTKCPVGTVMSRLARTRARLRADMGLGSTAPVLSLI